MDDSHKIKTGQVTINSTDEEEGNSREEITEQGNENIGKATWDFSVMGDFHQASQEVFSHEAVGTQCSSISVMAILAAQLKSPLDWTNFDINEIVLQGDRAHSSVLQTKGWPYLRQDAMLDLDEIPDTLQCHIGGINAKASLGILTGDASYGFELRSVLSTAIRQNAEKCFVMRFGDKCSAIIKCINGAYAVFDSHACNIWGAQDPEGSACIMGFSTAGKLIHHLEILRAADVGLRMDRQIDVTPIDAAVLDSQDPQGVTKAPFLTKDSTGTKDGCHQHAPQTQHQSTVNIEENDNEDDESDDLPSFDVPAYYHDGDKELPIYTSGKCDRFGLSEAINIVLNSQAPRCSKVPLRIRCNRAFLINLKALNCQDDVKADMNGVYKKGLRTCTWTVKVGLHDVQIMKKKKDIIPPSSTDVYHIHINSRQNEAGLCRSIFTLYDKEGNIVNDVSLLQYHISSSIGTSVEFSVLPHGNRKHDNKPFFPTQKSLLQKIKDNVKDGSQSSLIYNYLSRGDGSIFSARQPGELPRSRQQVYQFQANLKADDNNNDLYIYSDAKEESIVYDHWVNRGDEIWVLGTEQMSFDLERFCTSKVESYPLSVDPTFEFGKFEVTPFTYRNLLLTHVRSEVPPIFLGPTAIHSSKDEGTFDRMVSSVTRKCPKLKEARGYITDGETALYNALKSGLPKAVGLRCFRHFLSNCKDKLSKLGIRSKKDQSFFLDFVFGKNGSGGFVDCDDLDDLAEAIENAKVAMDCHEATLLQNDPDYQSKFWKYIRKNQKMIGDHMVGNRRKMAGFGVGPNGKTLRAYTNQSESMNNILTRQKEAVVKARKKDNAMTKLGFVKNVWEEVTRRQENEMSLAICGLSAEYRLSDRASYLTVDQDVWFQWPEHQRRSYAKAMNELTMEDLNKEKKNTPSPVHGDAELYDKRQPQRDFSMDLASKLSGLIAQDVLSFLIQEAKILLNSPNAVKEMPTVNISQDKKKYFVATKACKKQYFSCTAYKDHVNCECPAFKKKFLCQHSICVAELNGNIQQHVTIVLKKQNNKSARNPPKDAAGKKGGQHRNQWRPRPNDRIPHTCTSASSNDGSKKSSPPLIPRPFTEVHHNNEPLVVTFVSDEPKAIFCQQCHVEFPGRFHIIPFDMILSHRERWVYIGHNNPTKTPRRSALHTTKFYCVRSSCVIQRFHYFDATIDLTIPESVRNRLQPSHLKHLQDQLNYGNSQ